MAVLGLLPSPEESVAKGYTTSSKRSRTTVGSLEFRLRASSTGTWYFNRLSGSLSPPWILVVIFSRRPRCSPRAAVWRGRSRFPFRGRWPSIPQPGSTFLDAEHVVILMQENRSFDHCYGTLRGVRGFNDPRAMTLPDGNPVWLQTNAAGETYAPFRLNIKDTKATWIGSCRTAGWISRSRAMRAGTTAGWR